jgi:hypothetical protein
MTHRIERNWSGRLQSLMPFGLGQTKPHHFREMARVAWENRDNWRYAWNVLRRGVCDGCALGVAGFHDWTLDGVHLCMTRLNLLRLNTMPALDVRRLADVDPLRSMNNAELRSLGRLPHPMRRVRGVPGFTRISWSEAYAHIARRVRATDPHRVAFYLTARGLTNETYYVAQKVARLLGTNNIDNAALLSPPSTGAGRRSGGGNLQLRDWWGTDLIIFFGSNPANDQPVAIKYLDEAKRLGTKVVLVNPYREPGMDRYWVPSTPRSALFGSDVMDYWFPVSTGGDIAFLTGVIKILIANGWVDATFITQHTAGFEALALPRPAG